MKRCLLLLLSFVLFSNGFTQKITVSITEEKKSKASEKKYDDVLLTWQDFKGEALEHEVWYAKTFTYWSYSLKANGRINKSINIDIATNFYFDKSKSFKKSIQLDSAQMVHVLKHEQLHFCIAYYWYHQFTDSIKNFTFSKSYNNEMRGIYNYFQQQVKSMQELYDLESDHSINNDNQILWVSKMKLLFEEKVWQFVF
jgi:hypothetical protein